jgi:hypothetical protein
MTVHDWIEWVGPPLPEEPKAARIALWMHDDDYFESYYLNALIWRTQHDDHDNELARVPLSQQSCSDTSGGSSFF